LFHFSFVTFAWQYLSLLPRVLLFLASSSLRVLSTGGCLHRPPSTRAGEPASKQHKGGESIRPAFYFIIIFIQKKEANKRGGV
jgi:hypothetical protein